LHQCRFTDAKLAAADPSRIGWVKWSGFVTWNRIGTAKMAWRPADYNLSGAFTLDTDLNLAAV
jgi:hypothetical protein